MSGIREVLAAATAAGGSTTVDEIAARTGMDAELVRVALHQLVSLGLLGRDDGGLSCPPAGCGGCAVGACGAAPSRGGAVALTPRLLAD